MFVENKYTKWYNNLVKKAKMRSVLRTPVGLYEKHHIIPKCCGGSNDKSNLVCLTPREHFIAHLLLTKMVYDNNLKIKLSWALHRMVFSVQGTSRLYDHYRKVWAEFQKNNHHAHREGNENYRKKLSDIVSKHWEDADERRQLVSRRMKDTMETMKKEDPDFFYKRQKEYAKLGGKAARQKNSTRIEYKGKIYLGWKTFSEETGVSKELYKKYYLNGIDPEFRIGSNGPIPNAGARSSEGGKSDDSNRFSY
jgi:hypothetical protein